MKHQLAENIYLIGRTHHLCAWSAETIRGPCVKITGSMKHEPCRAVLSAQNVTQLIDALRRHKQKRDSANLFGNDINKGSSVGYTNDDLYIENIPENRLCPICEHDFTDAEGVYKIELSLIHAECVGEFISVLEDVWDYNEEMLTHRFE